jgi:hypothetical protein
MLNNDQDDPETFYEVLPVDNDVSIEKNKNL